MRLIKKTSLLLILLTSIGVAISISCEPDDICPASTATTPSLIIDVYNVDSTDDLLAVNDLLVYGVDNDIILYGYEVQTLSQIVLPLKTDVNTTQFALVKDAILNDNGTTDITSDDYFDGDGNIDIITINYSREEVYVSRACGYKTIYKNVTFTIVPDDDNWIKSRQPLNDNQSVENETETHFNIFH